MFTLSVAFLFFSASSFQLLVTLVLKGFGKQIGSDILIWAPIGMLEEGPLRKWLDKELENDETALDGYSFTSIPLDEALKLGDKAGSETMFMGPSQISSIFKVAVHSVPENWFDVVDTSYYVAKDEQEVEDIPTLDTGYLDPIKLLYSSADRPLYPETEDSYNKNAYKITF